MSRDYNTDTIHFLLELTDPCELDI